MSIFKFISRKVIVDSSMHNAPGYHTKNRCPRCRHSLTWEYQRYCNQCGQKLKW